MLRSIAAFPKRLCEISANQFQINHEIGYIQYPSFPLPPLLCCSSQSERIVRLIERNDCAYLWSKFCLCFSSFFYFLFELGPGKCVKLSAHYFKCVPHTHTHLHRGNKAVVSNRCVNVSSRVSLCFSLLGDRTLMNTC